MRCVCARSGLDPDLVFYLWSEPHSNSWCGVPGPWCGLGSPTRLAVGAKEALHLPYELTDLYTLEEWLTLRQKIERALHKYQHHWLPFGICTALCCLPCCLESSLDRALEAVLSEENIRLNDVGIFWNVNSDRGRPTMQIRKALDPHAPGAADELVEIKLVTTLKVQPEVRLQYEQENPTRRRLWHQPLGQVLFPIQPPPPPAAAVPTTATSSASAAEEIDPLQPAAAKPL